jgi:hypothetical protein
LLRDLCAMKVDQISPICSLVSWEFYIYLC